MSAGSKRSLSNTTVAMVVGVVATVGVVIGRSGGDAGGLYTVLAVLLVVGLLGVFLGDVLGRTRRNLHLRWIGLLAFLFGPKSVGLKANVQSVAFHRKRR